MELNSWLDRKPLAHSPDVRDSVKVGYGIGSGLLQNVSLAALHVFVVEPLANQISVAKGGDEQVIPKPYVDEAVGKAIAEVEPERWLLRIGNTKVVQRRRKPESKMLGVAGAQIGELGTIEELHEPPLMRSIGVVLSARLPVEQAKVQLC